jgi:hypothetical protein
LIAEQGLAGDRVATGLFLSLRDDGALLVSWHDRLTLEIHEHILEFEDDAV